MNILNKKILLTESLGVLSRELQIFLNKNRFQVIYSDNQELTKSLLLTTPIDLVITKFESCQVILDCIGNSLPILILTPDIQDSEIKKFVYNHQLESKWNIFSAIIELPISYQELLSTLSKIFGINLDTEILDKNSLKKKCAIFTLSNNESVFLPKWIKHYKRFFESTDIYILDHQSSDNSTANLDVNVIKINNDYIFDRDWMISTIEKFQNKLLDTYRCVTYCNVDEIIYSPKKPLNEIIDLFLQDDEVEIITCDGYEIRQQENESPLKSTDNILFQRNYWSRNNNYDKSSFTKVPLKYEQDMRFLIGRSWDFSYQLKYQINQVHFKKCDFNIMADRQILRLNNFKSVNLDMNTSKNTKDRWEILSEFKSKSALELIPDEDKIALNWF